MTWWGVCLEFPGFLSASQISQTGCRRGIQPQTAHRHRHTSSKESLFLLTKERQEVFWPHLPSSRQTPAGKLNHKLHPPKFQQVHGEPTPCTSHPFIPACQHPCRGSADASKALTSLPQPGYPCSAFLLKWCWRKLTLVVIN